MLGVTALLTACTGGNDAGTGGDDTPSQYAISFGAQEGQHVQTSRASTTTPLADQGYNEMKVYGYKTLDGTLYNVMPGYTMKYVSGSANSSTSNSSGWEYVGQGTDYLGLAQEIKYWDGNTQDYRFFGVLNNSSSSATSLKYKADSSAEAAEIGKTTAATTAGSFVLSFSGLKYMTRKQETASGSDAVSTVYYDATGNKVEENNIPIYGHLWQGSPAANYSKPVTLEFVKPYSLIRVVFVRPAGSTTTQLGNPDETARTHDITFAPVSGSMTGSGDLTITYPMTGSEESYQVAAGTTSTTLDQMSLGTVKLQAEDVQYQVWPEYVMIPTNATGTTMVNGDFKCTAYIYTKNSSNEDVYTTRTAVVPAAYMQWKPGYQYTYIFKITSNNNMEFSHVVEVYTQWQAGYVQETEW